MAWPRNRRTTRRDRRQERGAGARGWRGHSAPARGGGIRSARRSDRSRRTAPLAWASRAWRAVRRVVSAASVKAPAPRTRSRAATGARAIDRMRVALRVFERLAGLDQLLQLLP